MKSMQRKFGAMSMVKRSADDADVSGVISDFKIVDELLDRLIRELKTWRDGWQTILKVQLQCADALVTLYKPIKTADNADTHHVPAETPQQYMQKCLGLQQLYSESLDDLSREIEDIDRKVLGVAETAKLHVQPLHKTMKHRDNMKLDFEKFLKKVEGLQSRGELKNQKEEIQLSRYEADLAQAKINYQTADEHVKENFPGVTDTIYTLIPFIRTAHIMLQTTIVGQMYTVLDAYTRYQKMANPAPPDSEIISAWNDEFTPLKKELEGGLKLISTGRVVHTGMTLSKEAAGNRTFGGWGRGNKAAPPPPIAPGPRESRPSIGSARSISPRPSIGMITAAAEEEEEQAPIKPPRPGASPASMSKPTFAGHGYTSQAPPPSYDRPTNLAPTWSAQPKKTWSDHHSSSGASPPSSQYGTPREHSSSPTGSTQGSDYFVNKRTSTASTASNLASQAAAAVAKKKPPPPVPVKRIASSSVQYVTALFDFEAQNAGDLPFCEGDRIRVVKKTDSTDDWWTGELKGVTGSFPANYVEL